MMVRLSHFVLPALAGLAMPVLSAGAANAGPPALRIEVGQDWLVRMVFDDGGWRVRGYKCCRGRLDGSSGRILERGHTRRLGDARNRFDASPTYGDRNDDGYSSLYGGPSVYDPPNLTPPRVFQPGAGGGYFGNPD